MATTPSLERWVETLYNAHHKYCYILTFYLQPLEAKSLFKLNFHKNAEGMLI